MVEAATDAEERACPRSTRDGAVRVLVVDDESSVRNAVSRVLRGAGMLPSTVESGSDALQLLETEPFDVALVDVRMPGMTGPQLLSHMTTAQHPAVVIMMTAFADIATTVSAVKAGAYAFLTKPFVTNEAIIIEVLNAARHKRLCERTERLQQELAHLRPDETPRSPQGEAAYKTALDVVAALSLHELGYADARRRLLDAFTEAYVSALLESTRGNTAEAARRAGLDDSNFGRLLRSRESVLASSPGDDD